MAGEPVRFEIAVYGVKCPDRAKSAIGSSEHASIVPSVTGACASDGISRTSHWADQRDDRAGEALQLGVGERGLGRVDALAQLPDAPS